MTLDKREIRTREPAQKPKPATLEDVARAVGVSAVTVSNVLNGKRERSPHREAILAAVARFGFEPNPHAQRLAGGRCHNTIGLFSSDLDLNVGTRKIQIIQGLLHDAGFIAPLHAYGRYVGGKSFDRTTLLRNLCRQRPRAIVCYTFADLAPDALAELRRYQSEGGLVVSYDHPVPLDCDQVLYDPQDSTYQSAQHLLMRGHRRLGFYTFKRGGNALLHLPGFERALGEWGLAPRGEWLFRPDGKGVGDSEEAGAAMAEHFLAQAPGQRPTGLSIVNDYSAIGFISLVGRAGVRVPGDVSVVGRDDTPLARHVTPALTTVTHPIRVIAHTVVELLRDRLEGRYDGPARQVAVRGELIARQSTSGPP